MLRGTIRAVAMAAVTAALIVGPVAPVSAHDPVRLPPQAKTDCAGEVPVVVGSDAAAQSDIYSAVTLAGALGSDCVVLAGPRDGAFSPDQLQRLDSAQSNGYVVGGEAAVPQAKVHGRDLVRIAGADRWETAALVGDTARQLASGDATQPASSISGSGNAVKYVTLTTGRWLVEASVSDNHGRFGAGTNFSVSLVDPEGDHCELVANDIGTEVRDSAVVQISADGILTCPPGEFAVEIDAVGSWTVTFTKR